MSSAPEKLVALRELLARRFPQASQAPRTRTLATGIRAIDDAAGGLPIGALTEIVCSAPSCGGMLLLSRVLEVCRAQRLRVALVDGSDSFDPQSSTQDALAHLVWVRCQQVRQAMQAADLLVRDANFGLVMVDVRRLSERELRQEPATLWYRLQRAAEQNELSLIVETPRALVPSAMLRFVLPQSFGLTDLDSPRAVLTDVVAVELQRQRRQLEEEAV
jgi:recA bacterial DNA recombination protein